MDELERGVSPFAAEPAEAPPPDPTAHTNEVPRNRPSNDNPQVGSVGSGVPAGFGDTHVIYPAGGWHSTAWQGWPVAWDTPFYRPVSGGPGVILPGGWLGTSDLGRWMSSVVWACVDLNARALQQMDPQITTTQVVAAQRVQIPQYDDLPAWISNPHPDVYSAWGDFVQALVVALEVLGEAFVIADTFYANGFPATFFVANNDAVEIVQQPDPDEPSPYAFRWAKTGRIIGEAGERILHVRYMTVPGDVHGHGPLEGAWRALQVVRALEDYGAQLAAEGGVPWGVLMSKTNLGKGGAETLQAQWRQAAANRRGGPAVLTGELELDMLTINPEDMAMIGLLTFYAQRICGAFGVPPFLVGVPSPEGLTYSNANGLFDFHYRSTLQGLSVNMMSSLSGFLLPRGRNVNLLPDKYIQPDLLTRSNAKKVMFDAGALSVNEWRASEGLPPIAGGDKPLATTAAPAADPSVEELEAML